MDPKIRCVRREELDALLALYAHLHKTDAALPGREALEAVWEEILQNPSLVYLVAEQGGVLLASANLAVVPNLTRGARPWAVIENVVTHAEHRRRGLARRVLDRAIEIARERGCYKIMLMTGSKTPGTHAFYRNVGFSGDAKVGYVLRIS